jgi:hypothetical protein
MKFSSALFNAQNAPAFTPGNTQGDFYHVPRMTGLNGFAGHLGGVAPHVQGAPRGDFSFHPQFIPGLTVAGGLKTPPRF